MNKKLDLVFCVVLTLVVGALFVASDDYKELVQSFNQEASK